jgi:acyl phosphate:glycerol-3-phosphate acyltransferase
VSVTSVLVAVGLVVFGYLMGSLSPSVFLGRLIKKVDVRRHGSGNAGTTNAFRVLGTRLGVAVLILDIVKGVIPVVLAKYLSTPLVTVFVAFATVVGHDYSIFLRGHGGKGVATGAGAAIGMMPIPMAFLFGLFATLVVTTRIVSVASITCTIALPIMAGCLHVPVPYIVACCLMSALVLWAHRGNMKRLWRREERRVSFPWNKKPTVPDSAIGSGGEAQAPRGDAGSETQGS